MEGVRGFLDSSKGKAVAIVLVIVALLGGTYVVISSVKGGTPGDPNNQTYVCSETGKSFKHRNEAGESIPIVSPYTGRNTGYPAEPCYWTASGEIKTEPTWVLLNEMIGKRGPTFCPDCGRLVILHNPEAVTGKRPPITQKEYAARRAAQ